MTQPPCAPTCASTPSRELPSTSGAHDVADRMGIGVSLTCAVHCAAAGALSVAPSVVPSVASLGLPEAMLGSDTSLGSVLELAEAPLLALALAIGLWSLVPAYRREHGSPRPLALFALGVATLAASRFVDGVTELALTLLGVTLVSAAHLVNLRACARVHRDGSHSAPGGAMAPEAVATADGRP